MEAKEQKKQLPFRKYAIIESIVWTVILIGFISWNIYQINAHTKALVTHETKAFFQQILVTRSWNASHGGVYVPVTKTTKPNQYMDVPERDIISKDNKLYTLVNPAFMTRQIAEVNKEKYFIQFRLISQTPINPANISDEWESIQLQKFKKGIVESAEFTKLSTKENIFRYMAPLFVERACLECHAEQGYELNEVRGGISIRLNANKIIESQRTQIQYLLFSSFFIWVLGMAGIFFASRQIIRGEKKRETTIEQLNQALEEVNTLSGLIPICAKCKKIRDDHGYWNQIESYIESHSEAEFSHGLCQDCSDVLYGDQKWYQKAQAKKDLK